MMKQKVPPPVADINVTPMVDVMLVMLIIFMVITPMLSKGKDVDMVKTKNAISQQAADKTDAIICAVTRLGYYNVHHHEQSGFVGLPTTLAALLWSTLFLLHPSAPSSIAALVGIGLAMVLFFPVPRPRGVAWWAYLGWRLARGTSRRRRVRRMRCCRRCRRS